MPDRAPAPSGNGDNGVVGPTAARGPRSSDALTIVTPVRRNSPRGRSGDAMPLFRSETVEVDRDVDGSLHLSLDVPERPVNVLSRRVLSDLDEALDAIAGAARTAILVVRSGKKSGFI